ncbi:type II toxin-antitoxin system HipA family toxin [Pseudomonas sp.]|uniref:type II toxin-antitoxin system HipA family toxin n=1 Tax=Pseudomonas sp. TaxID=306 RepID=UPI0028A8D5EA|nr:type II toxin-antitoxin system HipA family toxin [Pseudomonas sp.]
MIHELQVFTPENVSGLMFRAADGDYVFRYGSATDVCPISLTMPVRRDEYRRRELHPIFQMNLPEGYLLEQLKYRLAKVVKIDAMLLLALAGGNSPIGRVGIRSAQVQQLLSAHASSSKGEQLEDILTWDGTQDLFLELANRYILRSGISGVQPKVLVPETQELPYKATAVTGELIVKSGRDAFPHLAINEFLCMSIASAAGISTPEFYLSDDKRLFVMRRFDRTENLDPLGFEDMAVLMGLGTEQKYSKSYEMIAKAIGIFVAPARQTESLHRLFDIVALSCIVGNGDAHLKNFGLLYGTAGAADAALAPAYDIVSTTAYLPDDSLALTLNNQKSLCASRVHLLEFGRLCRVEEPRERIREILQAVEGTLMYQEELAELAPQVVRAIQTSAAPFEADFG